MPDPDSPVFEGQAASDPGPANRLFYPALDGLRAVAFLMVFGQHYVHLSWGWTGVDIFFVLSGFLITGILFDTRDQPHHVWNFYIRRTLRIFPLYHGVFTLLLMAYPIFRWEWDIKWILWPLYLGNVARFLHPYAPNSAFQRLADAQPLSRAFPAFRLYLGHFWSLCVEEQFYIFWPWVVFYVKERRRLLFICLASVLITPFLRVLGKAYLPDFLRGNGVLYSLIVFRTDALLLGGLLALTIRGGYQKLLLTIARLTFLLCVGAVTIWLLLNPSFRSLELTSYPPWIYTWFLSFVDLFAAALIVMALDRSTWAYEIFNVRPLRWLGRISYGAYVLHDIPHGIYTTICLRLGSATPHRVAALALPCTLIMAWLSFRFFESPFIRLKEKLSR